MPSTGLLPLPPRPRPSPSPTPQRVQNPYLPARAPAQQPPPLSARHVFDNIEEDNPVQYTQDGSFIPFDDPSEPEGPLVSPPGFCDNGVCEFVDNHSNSPIDPYTSPVNSLCIILNLPHCLPCKKVFFQLPSPPPKLVSCRYTPTTPSPYLPLTSTSPSLVRAVCDSGASHTMTSHLHLFDCITYFDSNTNLPHAMMGDDTTTLPITGYGYIHFTVHGRRLRLFSYFVPGLGTTLLSIKQHMCTEGCYFHAAAENTVLAFPTF
jgi:hypothetical protein